MAVSAAPAAGSRRRKGRARDRLAPYVFVAPAFLLFLVFVAAPVLGAFALSLLDWDLLSSPRFAGASNYTRLLHDGELHKALWNTFIFTFWSIVLHVGVGLALAMAVTRGMGSFTRAFLRTTIFFPFLVSWAAVALIWEYAYDPSFGFFSYYAGKLGVPSGILLNSGWALPALIFVDLWHTIGFSFVVFLGGLQAVPQQLYEAATVDGATAWRRFWNVTLPMLSPTLFFVSVISFIGAFQIFEPMFIMTRGGPGGSTESVVQYLYETAFRDFRMGYAAAIALLVFVVILLATLIQFRLRRRWVHEG